MCTRVTAANETVFSQPLCCILRWRIQSILWVPPAQHPLLPDIHIRPPIQLQWHAKPIIRIGAGGAGIGRSAVPPPPSILPSGVVISSRPPRGPSSSVPLPAEQALLLDAMGESLRTSILPTQSDGLVFCVECKEYFEPFALSTGGRGGCPSISCRAKSLEKALSHSATRTIAPKHLHEDLLPKK